MSALIYQIVQCMRPGCRFRYPTVDSRPIEARCPKCGGPVNVVEHPHSKWIIESKANQDNGTAVEALLDNIRSTYNVGSMMRSADGAGVRRLHLCGITPTPDHPKVEKTALGAEYAVPWIQYWNAVEAAYACKQQGMLIWVLEAGPKAEQLFDALPGLSDIPILLVVGNEVSGVDPKVMQLCDRQVAIPMLGAKESLNVATAFGIAVYFLRFGYKIRSTPIEGKFQ
jgi:tRNA G18 (ribose-2'-O)-methylase SpoU